MLHCGQSFSEDNGVVDLSKSKMFEVGVALVILLPQICRV
jgi:hypothetical protein